MSRKELKLKALMFYICGIVHTFSFFEVGCAFLFKRVHYLAEVIKEKMIKI